MTIGLSSNGHEIGQTPKTWERSYTKAPLGLDQERLWLVEQLHPGSNTYNISFGLHITGDFSVELLKLALEKVVRRHEVLRSFVLPDETGRPENHILSSLELPVNYIDLRPEDVSRRKFKLRAEMDRHVERGFDLSKAPLMRILVIQDSDNSYYVIETAHHSVIDRWSYVRFNQELLGFYRELAFGEPYTPPALSVQYFDFAVRQRNWLEENKEEIRQFWSNYLEGVPTRDTLPYDYSLQSTDRTGGHCNFIVNDDVARGVIRYARKNRMTLNSALIGTYAALLYERTGNRDIVIGFPSVVRNDPTLNNVIGFLLTNIPIRVRIPENPTLASIIKQVRNATADVSGFVDTPYSEIIAAISPKRAVDEYPLIQTMASSLEFEEELFNYEAGEIAIIEVMDGVSPNDLTLGFWKSGERLQGGFEQEGIHGRLEYRTALFHPHTVEALVGRLLELLADVSDNRVDLPISVVSDRTRSQDRDSGDLENVIITDKNIKPYRDNYSKALESAWNTVLGNSVSIYPFDDFFERGGNSLLAVRLTRVLREIGYSLPVREIFVNSTFEAMTAKLRQLSEATPTAKMTVRNQAPASPEQLRFLDSDLERPERWAHSVIFECKNTVTADRLKQSLIEVVKAHRVLTAKFECTSDGWRMVAGKDWHWQEVNSLATDAEIIKQHTNLLGLLGPLFCATWITSPIPRLILTASHLIMDGWSWTVLEQEVTAAYQGERIIPEVCDYFDYSTALIQFPFENEVSFWNEQTAGIEPLPSLSEGSNLLSAEQLDEQIIFAHIGFQLGQTEAVTAVASALLPLQASVVLDIVADGREPFPGIEGWDPSRAIGNYACIYPLRVPVSGLSLEDDSRAVAGALASVPHGGKGFGVLRSFKRILPEITPIISVNYIGHLTRLSAIRDAIFVSRRDVSMNENTQSSRSHILNVDIGMRPDGVNLVWRTNPEVLLPDCFDQIVTTTNANLLGLIKRPELHSRGGRYALSQADVNAHFSMLCARGWAARMRVQKEKEKSDGE